MAAITGSFHREYLYRLPLPLAQLYGRANNAKDARGWHDNCFYLFEALIKLTAGPLTACYLAEIENGSLGVAALDRLLAQLALPSLGQWLAIVRELSRHFGMRPDSATHPLGHLWGQLNQIRRGDSALLALYRRIKNGPDQPAATDTTCTTLQVLDALVRYRNEVFGHGAERFLSFYETDMGPLLFPAADELLAEGSLELLGPRGSRLVHLSDLRMLDDRQAEVGLRELIGQTPERATPLAVTREESSRLAPNIVGVLWPGRKLPVRLDPLLLYREGETSDEVLFLNRDRNGRQVEYLSYTTGRTQRDASTAASLAALLGKITGRPFSAKQLQDLADQSLSETPSVESLLQTPSPAGQVLGEYELLAEVGRGGMGVVYLARQLSLGRLVALKMLPSDLAADDVALARFRREMRALARCDHPHIVKVLASGAMPDGRLYYAMEYVPGCDLEQVWRELAGPGAAKGDSSAKLGDTTFAAAVLSASRKKRQQAMPREEESASEPSGKLPRLPLPPLPQLPPATDDPGSYVRRVVLMIRDAASALQAVHDQQIIHRDIKPANLMLTADAARVVLMDFGLAKGQSLELSASRAGGLLGTLRYASPEQLAAASLKVGPSADVRGLGVVLWELLTRRRLFAEAEDEQRLTQYVLTADVPRLRTVDKSFDADLEAIVARATERSAADRIASAGLLNEYLGLWLEGKPLPIRPPGAGEMLRRWVKAHRSLVISAAAAVVVVLVVSLTAFVIVNRERAEKSALALRNGKLAADNGKLADDALGARNQAVAARNDALAAANRIRHTLSDTDARIGHLLMEEGRDGEALPYEARALEEDAANQAAVTDSVALLRRYRSPLVMFRHDAVVWSAAFSPDGTRVVTASEDKTARVWDAATGKPLGEPMRHESSVNSAAFSPDGTRVVTASIDHTARVWDAATGKPLGEPMRHEDSVNSAAFSPDGRRVVTASDDKTARMWDAATGKPLSEPMRHDDSVSSAAFSPDGTRVVTASMDHTARVWEAATAKPLGEPMRHESYVFSAAFSPEGTRVVTASNDKTARVWDAATGKPLGEPMRHEDWVRSAAFSPDGRRVVTASEDKTARVWDAATGKPLSEPMRHDDSVSSAAFSPDGTRVVTASEDKTARVWDAATGKPLGEPMRHESSVNSAAFSPDGTRVVTASMDHTARVWDAATGKPLGEPMRDEDSLRSAAFSPDGRRVVTASDDKTARMWDAATGKPLGEPMRHESAVNSAAFSSDGTRVVTASMDHTARVWDAATGKPLGEPMRHEDKVFSAAFSPDGRRVVTASWDRTARVWDAATGNPLGEPMRHEFNVESAAFSPDGRRVVTASWDRTARVWDAATGNPLGEPMRHEFNVESAAFSPDGTRVVTASDDKTARMWDAATGKPLGEPMRHEDWVTSAAFSPDGTRVVTASIDHTARVWDAATGKPLGEPMRHEDSLRSAAFSPDGTRVVTASDDKTARVWDAATGNPLGEPMRHEFNVESAAFSPDGTRVVTASDDKTARVWDVAVPARGGAFLAQLDQLSVRSKLGPSGYIEPLADWIALRDSLKQQARATAATQPSARWTTWFLADHDTHRTISPFSTLTVGEWIVNRLEENTAGDMQTAWEIDPNNPRCLARRACSVIRGIPDTYVAAAAPIYVQLYSRRAVELAPNDAEVCWRRAAMLAWLGRRADARQSADSCPPPRKNDLWAWEARWEACESLKRDADAFWSLAIAEGLANGRSKFIRDSLEQNMNDFQSLPPLPAATRPATQPATSPSVPSNR